MMRMQAAVKVQGNVVALWSNTSVNNVQITIFCKYQAFSLNLYISYYQCIQKEKEKESRMSVQPVK